MKIILVLAIAVCLLLAAGCTGTTSAPQTPTGTSPSPAVKHISPKETSVMKSGNYSLMASIDQIQVDTKADGTHIVNIYLLATNTGTEPVRMVWYSKLTDKNGVAHGGLGVSHGGSGAQTFVFYPNTSGSARDYVTIDSLQDYAALKEGGATLDVVYADQKDPLTPIPDMRSRWTLEPDYFT